MAHRRGRPPDRLEEAKGSFRTALELAELAKDPGAAAYRAHIEAATARVAPREFNPTWPGLPNLCGKAGDRGWEDHHHHGERAGPLRPSRRRSGPSRP